MKQSKCECGSTTFTVERADTCEGCEHWKPEGWDEDDFVSEFDPDNEYMICEIDGESHENGCILCRCAQCNKLGEFIAMVEW